MSKRENILQVCPATLQDLITALGGFSGAKIESVRCFECTTTRNGFRVFGFFRIQGFGFRVSGSGFRVVI